MLKLTLRSIRRSFGRYLAILLIVALGVGFFCGLRLTKTAMLHTLDRYTKRLDFYDLRLVSTLGLTEADVEAAAALPGVRLAEGSKATDVLVNAAGQTDLVYHCISLPAQVNRLKLQSGRLPEKPEECLADAWNLSEADLGSEITVSEKNEADTLDCFAQKRFTVVGLVYSPLYLNFERGGSSIGSGSVSAFFYVPEDALSMDYYTDLYLKLSGADGAVYSDRYNDAVEAARADVEAFLEQRAGMRYAAIRQEAQDRLDEAKEELDGKRAELEDAKAELADGNQQYADAKQAYEDGKTALADERAEAEQQLADAKAELEESEKTLAEQKRNLKQGKRDLADAEKQLGESAEALRQANEEYEAASAELNGRIAAARAALEAAQADAEEKAAALQAAAERLAALQAQPEPDPEAIAAAAAEAARCQAELDEASAQLQALAAQQQAGAAELQAAQTQLEAGKQELDRQQAAYDAAAREIARNRTALTTAEQQIPQAEEAIAAGWEEYESRKAEAEARLQEAQEALDEAQTELRRTRVELDEAGVELRRGQLRLDEAQGEYEDGLRELEALEPVRTYMLDRGTNVGYACYESDSDIVEGVSRVFPLFFFLVAALVCITTMTRMVEEQRTQAGVLKALGYGNGAILAQYLLYSGSASVLGCAIGSLAGSWFLPKMIWQAYNIMYGFSDILWAFDWPLVLISSLAFLVCAMAATWYVCGRALSRPAAELLRTKAPKAGRRVLLERIPFLWRRLPFLRKVSVRNVLRDRRRMVMVILGIGGCTALLLTGYGIRDSITGVIDYQFEEVTLYDMTVNFHRAMDSAAQEEFLGQHAGSIGSALFLRQSSVDASGSGAVKVVYAVSSVSGTMDGFVDQHDENGPVPYPGDGECVINDGLADALKLSVGDRLTLRPSGRAEATFRVSGIFRNYVYHYVYLSENSYAEAFGNTDVRLALICAPEGADLHAVSADLASDEQVSNVMVNVDQRARIETMLKSMNYIVLVVIVCAGALAFIVLYNLTNISIIERMREIATVKVLGFYDRETDQYVFRENWILTVLGLIAGYPMGWALHRYVMKQIRIDMICFDNRIAPLSLLYAAVLTLLFGLIVNLAMRRRLRHIHMAEALKSGE